MGPWGPLGAEGCVWPSKLAWGSVTAHMQAKRYEHDLQFADKSEKLARSR
jgi:hypothetical protein